MTSVNLPEIPKGKEFEEFVSALFQSKGFYLDRNMILRKTEEVLEIDSLITDHKSVLPNSRLIEVKSGSWGFNELFKIRGWLDYLNMESGILVVKETRNSIDFFKKEASNLGIDLIVIDNLAMATTSLKDYFTTPDIDETDIECWRFSYWVERVLLQRLKHKKKSHQEKQCFTKIDDYFFNVNSSSFFTRNLMKRINRLYTAFQEHPRISAKCANELLGNSFDDDITAIPKSIFSETFYECKYNDIQVSLFVEHRARLSILKSAIDYKLLKNANINSEATKDEFDFLGIKDFSLYDFLPDSFKFGLDSISKDKYFHLYPYFWQWFVWVFGGFILLDYEEQEFSLLSSKTAIPIEEIPKALASYGKLFPQSGGWFLDFPNSRIRMLKLFPMPFAGIGANYRRFKYTQNQKYDELKLSGKHTRDDLARWNNLVIEILNSDK